MDGRIVIVDDEPITRLDIRDIVIEAGYEVVGEALMVLKQLKYVKTQPDLVLMDIQMPILDGLKAGKNCSRPTSQ